MGKEEPSAADKMGTEDRASDFMNQVWEPEFGEPYLHVMTAFEPHFLIIDLHSPQGILSQTLS